MPKSRASTIAQAAKILLLLTGLPGLAHADGKYWPEKAYEAPPRIPVQRAVLAFRDGLETLVIESTADSESPDLGWVVPLPSEPEVLSEVRPGLFESLAWCLGPSITHDLRGVMKGAGFVFAFVLLFVVVLAWSRSLPLAAGLLGLAAFCFLVGSFLSASLGVPSPDSAGIRVTTSKRVGSYSVDVLKAETPEALGSWLAASGLAALDDEERAVVRDYIEASWCFVVARIQRDRSGMATPHPIRLGFRCRSAVYPLRLTGLPGGATELDLFVVAERQAGPGELRTAFADRFLRVEGDAGAELEGELWRGRRSGLEIGHPDLEGLFWDGCVVARLRGSLWPDDMKDDLTFEWGDLRPVRESFFSRKGAWRTAVTAFFVSGTLGLLALLIFRERDFRVGGRRDALAQTGVVVLGVAVLFAIVLFRSLPIREVTVTSGPSRILHEVEAMKLTEFLGAHLDSTAPEGVAPMRRHIAELLAKEWSGRYRSAIALEKETGLPQLAAPGGYEVREVDGQTRVYYYDQLARARLVWPRGNTLPETP